MRFFLNSFFQWRPQAIVFELVTNKKFDMIIMLFIGLNMLTMTLDHYQQSPIFTLILDYLNMIFICIFSTECLMKIFALRYHYFVEPWNLFDVVVVVLSILSTYDIFIFPNDLLILKCDYLILTKLLFFFSIFICKIFKNHQQKFKKKTPTTKSTRKRQKTKNQQLHYKPTQNTKQTKSNRIEQTNKQTKSSITFENILPSTNSRFGSE